MKKLCLIRHAKSDWDSEFKKDIDRPLSKRGKKASEHLGLFMKESKLYFDLAYISPAARTIETCKTIEKKWKFAKKKIHSKELYEAHPEIILELIKSTSPSLNSVLILGHNPGLEDFASLVLGSGGISMFTKFPTAGLALFSFHKQKWKDLEEGTVSLDLFYHPPKKDRSELW